MLRPMTPTLLFRLALAALLGGLIGLEREYRAKEAGLRTHFLVALGSCLFMLVSQYGFDLGAVLAALPPGSDGSVRVDVSRVASQIVSGIGFIGAGMIVLQKRFVVGLTSAAGIWTTAAIGVAVGGGLYAIAAAATALALAGLEVFRLVDRRVGTAKHEMRVVFRAPDDASAEAAVEALVGAGATLAAFSATPVEGGGVRRSLRIDTSAALARPGPVLALLAKVPGIVPETVE